MSMEAYRDSEEIPDKSQELYYTLCLYIRKCLGNTMNTLLNYLKWQINMNKMCKRPTVCTCLGSESKQVEETYYKYQENNIYQPL